MIVALLSCSVALAATAQDSAPLHLKQTIPLPGVEGRIDHLALDAANERLFVCALGNNTIEVVDLRKGERIRSITGLGSPRSEEHTSELQSPYVISYAVFCLK